MKLRKSTPAARTPQPDTGADEPQQPGNQWVTPGGEPSSPQPGALSGLGGSARETASRTPALIVLTVAGFGLLGSIAVVVAMNVYRRRTGKASRPT
ncbi:MAG: hypothetical protein ABWY93_02900 [Mycobacterium sp.]